MIPVKKRACVPFGLIFLIFTGLAFPETLDTTVNQRANGGMWNEIGTFHFYQGSGGYLLIRNDGTDGYVIADAVMFKKDTLEIIVDNAVSSGVSITGGWVTSSSTAGYFGANYLHDNNAEKGQKAVRFTPVLPQEGDYTVFLRWTENPNRASNVPITLIYNAAPVSHHLTVTGGTGTGDYIFGQPVSLTADAPPAGCYFSRWVSSGGTFGMTSSATTTFTMPDSDAAV